MLLIKLSRKTWLFFVLPAVGIVILFVFLSKPKLKKIEELTGQIVQEKVNLVQLEKIARTKDVLMQEVSKMREEIDYYEKRIPSEKGTSWLLMELSRIARETGIRYVSIVPAEEKKEESYVRIPIQVQIKCGYHSLGRFLSRIENSQRFMTVDNLTISPDGSNPLRHNIILKISTFMFAK